MLDDWRELLLAVSMVYDQGERLPAGMRPDLLTRMVEVSQSETMGELPSGFSFRVWGPFFHVHEFNLSLESHELRFLGYLTFEDVMEEWHSHGYFEWVHVREATNQVGYILWALCACRPISAAEWRQCLSDANLIDIRYSIRTSPTRSEAKWIAPLAKALQEQHESNSRLSLRELFSIFAEMIPKLTKVTPLVLIMTFLGMEEERAFYAEHSDLGIRVDLTERLRRYPKLLAEFLTPDIDESWLIASTTMYVSAGDPGEHEWPDILQHSLGVLAARIADGTLDPSADIETVTRIIQQMLDRRAVLLAERGLPS